MEARGWTELTGVYAGSGFENPAMNFFLVNPVGFGDRVVFEVVEGQFLNRKSFETSGKAIQPRSSTMWKRTARIAKFSGV